MQRNTVAGTRFRPTRQEATIFIRAKPPLRNVAKHGKGRRRPMGKYIPGRIEEIFPLGTLGSRTLIKLDFNGNVVEKTFCSSVVAVYSMQGFTAAVDDGPITVGLAHSDYTAAEIEATIESIGSWE